MAVGLFCLLTAGCGNGGSKVGERVGEDIPEADASMQLTANENYLRLRRAFGGDRGEPASENYPEYYGGSFVGGDGRLVVGIVGDTAEGRRKILEMTGDDDFDVRPCRFSYRTLGAIMDSLDRFMSEAPVDDSVRHNVATVALMPSGENHIAVGLLDCSEDRIREFRERVMDSPAIVFECSECVECE